MNYIVNFENDTTTTFKTKRDLAAVVAYVRADGKHDVWSKHTGRAAARKFISSALAVRILDVEREGTDPARPMRFYVADAVAQD